MPVFMKEESAPPSESAAGGVVFMTEEQANKQGYKGKGPDFKTESPFWSMPKYGDGTAASLAATRPGLPAEKVGYGEIPKQLGRTGNELAATMTGTIPEFAGAVGAAAYDAARAPQTFPGMTAEQFQQMQQARDAQVPTPNPLAGAGAAAREAFGLNLPELQPDPQLSPENTPYLGDAPLRNKFLRLQNALGGMVAPGVSIGAGTALAGPLGGGAMAGTLFAAEKYQEFKDAGMPDDEALRRSAVFGGLSAGAFAVPVVASAAKFLPPGLASRVAVVAASAAEMGGKGMALGGIDAISKMENIPQSEEEWRKGLEDVVTGVKNARSSFVEFALMGAVGGLATPIGRAKVQAEAKAALDEFVDLGDATVRQPGQGQSGRIGATPNAVATQGGIRQPDGVRFEASGPKAITGPTEPQRALTATEFGPKPVEPTTKAQPTPEQLALEQQILGADLVDSRDIPKPASEAPKTAKEKLAAIRDTRKQSLIDTTVAQEATTQPTNPPQSDVEPQTPVGATQTAPETPNAVEAPLQEAEFVGLQERPRGQAPIALYNIPTPEGGKTTVTADTAKAQGFEVPEPPAQPTVAPEPVGEHSPETQAIVDAYGGRTKALEVLMRQRAAQRGNEKASPQTLAAIEELTGGKKTGQADLFGLGEIQKAPKADLPGQTRLPTETRVVAEKVNEEFASAPGSEALADFRKRVRANGIEPVRGWGQEEMGYKDEKIPWIKRSGSMTADQWLENALQEGLITQAEVTEPSTIRKLMGGRVDKKVLVQEEGFNVPALKGLGEEPAQPTGTTQRLSDIMKGIGLTEEKPTPKQKLQQKVVERKAEAQTQDIETVKSIVRSINGDPWVLAGPRLADKRQSIMSTLMGKKVPKAQSGVTAIREELRRIAGVPENASGYTEQEMLKAWASSEPESTTKAPASPVETTSATESTKAQAGTTKTFSERLSDAINTKDATTLKSMPGISNTLARKRFEQETGVSLPTNKKGTHDTIDKWSTPTTRAQATVPRKITVNKLLSLVPEDVVTYDSKKNTISFDASEEGITKVREAMDKALDATPQTPTSQAKYEEAYGDIMDAVFAKQEEAPKKGKRGSDPTHPEAGVTLNLSAMGDLVVAAAKGRPIIRNTKGLPGKVFDESIRARGLVNKYERRAQQVVADFEQGYRKSVGGVKGMMSKVPDNLLQLGTDYLTERSPAGKQAILSQFPPEMHAPLRQMRTLVDELTQKWIDWGVVSPGRTQILKNNKGSYLSRQYKTFNEPNFRNIIPEMVKQRMRNLLRKWDPSVPNTKAGDDIIEGRLNEWIDVSEDENSGLMWRGSPLGARNFGIMKQRNDFPQEVLDLWGVEKDVTKNLLNTVMKQAKPLANTIFQNKVLDHGRENNYIFTKADIEDIQSGKAPTAKAKAYGELQKNRQGTWMTEAAEQGKSASPYASMGVLADVYVPKPLKNAMQDMMKTQEHGLLMKTLLQYNGIAAMSKTVGSVTTQSLNFIANQGFFFGSGYAFYKPLTLANRINQAIAMTGTELKSTWGRSARELAGRGLELGVLNDADVSQEIAKLIEGGKGGVFSVPATKLAEWGDRYRANRTEKSRRAVGAAAQVPKWIQDVAGTLRDEAVAIYQAGDDFWKALMWLSDTEYQMDLHPSWSRANAEEAAAVAIREYGLPFYSESPRFIQNLRYVPIPAPFKTYAVEAPRVLINQATQAKSEIFSGNATATAMGFRRSLGQAFAYGMPIAGSIASALAWKLSDQDEDTIRDMGPEWNRDSNFVHYNVDRSKGIVKYWNVSRTSVQSEIGDPINAFIRGDEATDKAARLALASLDPFLQEQLGWKALRQVIENEDDYGRPIYNDADTDLEFGAKVGAVLGKSILPGTVESVRRILKDDAPIQKSLAEATGQRITTVNMPKELEYATRSYMSSVRAPSMDVKKAESGGNSADIAEQKRQRLDYHKEQWESLHDKVSGMKAFGVDTIRIMDALKKGGMSQKNINNLMYGVYVPPESMQ